MDLFQDLQIGPIVVILITAMLAYWTLKQFGRRIVHVALEKKRNLEHANAEMTEDERERIDTLTLVITKIGRWAIIIIAATMLLEQVNISIGPILTGAGVLGVALGFGAQSLVKDYLAGMFILIENQFAKGDVINTADITGKVVDMSLRRTVLRDLSGVEHHIPNGEMKTVSNFTKEWANVNMNISIAYESDIAKATEVLNNVAEAIANDPEWKVYILTTPTVLGLDHFGESDIQLKLHGRVEANHQWAINRELRKRIKAAFDKHGISIPYPHSVVVSADGNVGAPD